MVDECADVTGSAALARLLHENREQGADPDYRTATAHQKRNGDVPAETYERALDALERANSDPREA